MTISARFCPRSRPVEIADEIAPRSRTRARRRRPTAQDTARGRYLGWHDCQDFWGLSFLPHRSSHRRRPTDRGNQRACQCSHALRLRLILALRLGLALRLRLRLRLALRLRLRLALLRLRPRRRPHPLPPHPPSRGCRSLHDLCQPPCEAEDAARSMIYWAERLVRYVK